ncbi:MAG: hypothetical protein ACNA8S_12450 [Deferrisomatales bacterium]
MNASPPSTTPPQEEPRAATRRRFGRVLAAAALLALFLGVGLALLPSLLSSGWFRGLAAGRASEALGRPVVVEALRLAWSGRLLVEGLQVADLPEFSPEPLLTLDRLDLSLAPWGLLRSRLRVEAELSGLRVRLVRNEAGGTNLEALAGPPPGPAPEDPSRPREPGRAAGPFPREVSVRFRVDGAALEVEDRAAGRQAALREVAVYLDLPALGAPLTASISGNLEAGGGAPLPASARVLLERWWDPHGELDLASASARAEARFPGLEADLEADLAAGAAHGGLRVDLARVLAAASPFLPSGLAPKALEGTLAADLRAVGRAGEELAFEAALEGDGLRVEGPPLGAGRAVGPLRVRADLRGRADPARGVAEVGEGVLSLQRGTRLVWRGRAEGIGSPEARFEAALGPSEADLGELLTLGRDFLPPGLDIRLTGGRVRLTRAAASGPVPGAGVEGLTHVVAVGGLEVAAEAFEAAGAGVRTRGRRLLLSLESLEAALEDFRPRSAAVEGSLSIDSLDVQEPEHLRVEGFRIGELRGALSEVAWGPEDIMARGELRQTLRADALELPGRARLAGVEQGVDLTFALGPGGALEATLEDFVLRITAAEATQDGAAAVLGGDGAPPGLALTARRARVSGSLLAPGPPAAEASLDGAELSAGALRATSGDTSARVRGLSAALDGVRVSLREGFPERAALRARARAAEVSLTGPTEAVVRDLALSGLSVEAGGLRPTEGALLGVAGWVTLDQHVSVGEAAAAGRGRVEGLRQELRTEVRLDAGPTAEVSGGSFSLAADRVDTQLPEGPVGGMPLRAEARWEAVRLSAKGPGEPLRVDVEGLRAEAETGAFLRAALRADARDLGAEGLEASGEVHLDLARAAQALPSRRGPGTLTGSAAASGEVEGRLPAPGELEALRHRPEAWAEAPLPFLTRAAVQLRLEGLGADLPLGGTGGRAAGRLAFAGVETLEPVWVRVEDRGRTLALGGELVGRVEALPVAGDLPDRLGEPLRLRLGLRAAGAADGSLEARQFLEAEPLALRQEAELRVLGLDRWLRQGLGRPPALALGLLEGRGGIRVSLGGDPATSGPAPGGATLHGPLEAGAEATLLRGEELAATAFLRAGGASLRWGETAADGLFADVTLEKRYALARVAADAPPSPPWLSRAVLGALDQDLGGAPSTQRAPPRPARFASTSRIGLDRLRWGGGPVSLEARNLQLEVGLPDGLPWVERIELGLLGGSAVGAVGARGGRDGELQAVARFAFTGLDAALLAPGALGPVGGDEDGELSGRFSVALPLESDAEAFLGAAQAELALTRIGSRVLERALYALDPGESNEAVVRQRRLVRLGGPRWVRAQVRDGNLSVEGEVEARGVRLALPRLERLRVSQLPGLEGLGEALEALLPLRGALEAVRADVLTVDDAGILRFERGGLP